MSGYFSNQCFLFLILIILVDNSRHETISFCLYDAIFGVLNFINVFIIGAKSWRLVVRVKNQLIFIFNLEAENESRSDIIDGNEVKLASKLRD
jgi:hypothetical protein